MVIGKPCLMHHSIPGEISSFTLSMFASVILSPIATWARAGAASSTGTTASAAASLRVVVIDSSSLGWKRPGPPAIAWRPRGATSSTLRSVSGVHQRGHREPVVGDARLLALVEVPALLAREARARQRGLGRVLELQVYHDDRRDEAAVLPVVDHVGALEGLRAEAHVVEPDLPQLAGAVVDVGVRDDPRLLVDEDHALAVGVLWELGDALDHVDPALLPLLVEGPVDLFVPLHRVVFGVVAAEQVPLAEELEVHPGDVTAVAVVAVDVGVLAEERVRALRGGEPAYAAERRQVEPRVVLLLGGDVAVAERAHALQVERLEDRVEALLGAVAVGVRLVGLGIHVEPA